jgi:hypothetical protein
MNDSLGHVIQVRTRRVECRPEYLRQMKGLCRVERPRVVRVVILEGAPTCIFVERPMRHPATLDQEDGGGRLSMTFPISGTNLIVGNPRVFLAPHSAAHTACVSSGQTSRFTVRFSRKPVQQHGHLTHPQNIASSIHSYRQQTPTRTTSTRLCIPTRTTSTRLCILQRSAR